MKKIFLFGLLITAIGQAQVSFGPKASVSFSNIEESSITGNLDGKASFSAGGFLEYKFSRFALQGDINYTGLSFNNSGPASLESTLKFSTLNFYILPKFYFTDKVAIFAGPFVSNLLSADYDGIDYKSNFTSTNFGLAGGISANLFKGLFAEVKYSYGLTNVIKVDDFEYLRSGEYDPYIDGIVDLDSRISFFTAGLGYKF